MKGRGLQEYIHEVWDMFPWQSSFGDTYSGETYVSDGGLQEYVPDSYN